MKHRRLTVERMRPTVVIPFPLRLQDDDLVRILGQQLFV